MSGKIRTICDNTYEYTNEYTNDNDIKLTKAIKVASKKNKQKQTKQN